MKTNGKLLLAVNPLASKSYRTLAALGVFYLLLGLVALIWPGFMMLTVAIVIGAWLVIYGVERTISCFQAAKGFWPLLGAILTAVLGVLLLCQPLLAEWWFALLVGCWMIFTGIDQLAAVFSVPAGTPGKTMMMLNGILSLLIGGAVVLFPFFGIVLTSYLIGFYLVFFGAFAIAGASALYHAKNDGAKQD